MTYFRFEATDEQHDSTLTKEFEAVQLQDILGEFQYFLKGCGFEFAGNLELVPEETTSFGECGSWGNEDVNNFYPAGGVDFDSLYDEVDSNPTNPNLGGFKTSEGL
jgi:hypothetical protein